MRVPDEYHVLKTHRKMKILCHFILVSSIVLANAEAELPTTVVEELEAEHRSAKPEPFLEKLAAAIFGSNDKTGKRPVYQQTAGSIQRPVAVKPPRAPRPPQPPRIPLKTRPQPVYNGPQASASNNVQSFAPPQAGPGKKLSLTNFFCEIVLVVLRHFLECITYWHCMPEDKLHILIVYSEEMILKEN